MTETIPMPTGPKASSVALLVAKQQITEVLYRRARAADRRDVPLALSCYHAGATEEHEGYSGRAADFIQDVSMISPKSTAPVTALWHFISNILIEIDGETADVESYHIALVSRNEGAGEIQAFIGGRYLDKFAHREGRWAITHRDVVFDWSRVAEPTRTYWDLVGLDPSQLLRGAFDATDPLYSRLGISRG
jgi:hypothetical protein